MLEGNVLIVEDSRSITGLLEEKINKAGLGVHFARDHKSALELLETSSYSAFVTNMNWPELYWDECLHRAAAREIPVVVFSSTFNGDIQEKISQHKIYDHVVKSNSHSLEELVESIVTLHNNRELGVLVVDDSSSVREYTMELLRQANYIAYEAQDGPTGLDVVAKHPEIRLIVTDYEMPGMNGFEFTEKIREKYSRNQMAVIGFSRHSTDITTAGFLKHGANDFLFKPFGPEEFFARTRTILEIIKAYEDLQRTNSFKNKILGIVAHDLRNPITSISGCAEILKTADSLPPEDQELINYIDQACHSMTTLVNDLLDVSMIESGHLDINLDDIDLYQVLKERVGFFSLQADKKQITIALDGHPTRARLDKNRITQVVDNLVSNAIKYSKQGSQIALSLEKGDKILIGVKDAGPGLSPEDRKKLFGEFQKLSAKPTAGEASVGLGLAIVKKIVSAHQGRIWADNNPHEGATFFVELPDLPQ